MRHIIKKQVIEIGVQEKTDIFSLQQQLSDHYHQQVLPLIEGLFDKLAPGNETLMLDNVHVDMGIFTIKEIESGAWLNEFGPRLKQEISSILEKDPARRFPQRLNYCSQWLYYMEHGYLPWNATETGDDWYAQVLEAFAVDAESIDRLRLLAGTDAKALERIIHQHTFSFLVSLVELMTAKNQKGLAQFPNEIYHVFKALQQEEKKDLVMDPGNFKKSIWMQVFSIVTAAGGRNMDQTEITWRIIQTNFTWSQIKNISGNYASIVPQTEQIWKTLSLQKPKLQDMGKAEARLERKKDTIDNEGIFIPNAGLVLLHPFLTRFLKTLGLVAEGAFLNSMTQQKALYLLHFLATGSATAPEHDLVLPKLLCDYPLNEPVDTLVLLSEEQMSEADALLAEVIAQWTVLKNSSREALREGFLQRKGKLTDKKDHLFIQVETGSIDVLLDRLEWPLGYIRLPWMKRSILVQWR
jgi:hypothetical protein